MGSCTCPAYPSPSWAICPSALFQARKRNGEPRSRRSLETGLPIGRVGSQNRWRRRMLLTLDQMHYTRQKLRGRERARDIARQLLEQMLIRLLSVACSIRRSRAHQRQPLTPDERLEHLVAKQIEDVD